MKTEKVPFAYPSIEDLFQAKALELLGQLKLLVKQDVNRENFVRYKELVCRSRFLTELLMEYSPSRNFSTAAKAKLSVEQISELLIGDDNPYEKIFNPRPGAGLENALKRAELQIQLAG